MSKKCFDHLGNVYVSIAEMCRHYNISPYTFYGRIKEGWSIENILTMPVGNNRIDRRDGKICTDHLGNVYASITQMCEVYGITPGAYKYRRKKGLSIKDALLTPLSNKGRHTKPINKNSKSNLKTDTYNCTDHLGNVFSSKYEMCKYYNTTPQSLWYRLNKGMTLKEALTLSPKKLIPCHDHLGNSYKSINQMAKVYKTTAKTIQKKLNSGADLKTILTVKKETDFKKEEMLGKTLMMKCGVNATVVEYINNHNITVKFEDGAIRKPCQTWNFNKGNIRHPGLGLRGDNSFHGYKCKYLTTNKIGVWYETTAPDGTSDIMTPRMMMDNPKDE